MWNILGKITVKDEFSAAFDNLSKRMGEASIKADQFSDRMAGASLVAGATFAATATAAWKGMAAYEEYTNEVKRLDLVLKATNNRIGLSKEEIIGLANSYDRSSKFTKEAVLSSVSFLATQKNISGQIVKDALPAIIGLANQMKSDLPAATKIFAKALEDPEEGLNALSKAGVRFDEDQKNYVKALVASGKELEAQQYILERFAASGITVQATMNTNADKMSKAFGAISEAIGQGLTPVLQPLLDKLYVLAEEIGEFSNIIGPAIAFVGTLSGIFVLITGTVWAFSTAMGAATAAVVSFLLTNPLGWLVLLGSSFAAIVVASGGVKNGIENIGIELLRLHKFVLTLNRDWARLWGNKDMEKNMVSQIQSTKDKIQKINDDQNARKEKEQKESEAKEEKANKAKLDKAKTTYGKLFSMNSEANQDKKKQEKDEIKSLKAKYGDLSKEDMEYFKEKKTQEIKSNRRTLNEEKANFKKRARIAEEFPKLTEEQLDEEMQKKMDASEAQIALDQITFESRVSVAQNGAALLTQVLGRESKAAFLIQKGVSVAQAYVNMAAAMAAVPAQTSSIPYPANLATAAQMMASIKMNTALQVATIAASAIQGFATGGVVGGIGGASMGSDNQQATVRTGEMILNANQQKQLWDVANNNKSVNNNSNKVINDYSRTIINVKAGSKEFESIVKKVINDDKKEKARKDQFVRGRR